MAKKKLEDLYKTKGYPKTQIEIIEGNEKGDSNVVFVIHEDEHQKIWKCRKVRCLNSYTLKDRLWSVSDGIFFKL